MPAALYVFYFKNRNFMEFAFKLEFFKFILFKIRISISKPVYQLIQDRALKPVQKMR